MKQTGKIELLKGTLIPTKRGLWYSASEKLIEAQAGIVQMSNAEDRVGYESGWVRFVESLEESWSSFFEEGTRSFKNFQPWAGAKEKERKSDSLLNYLIQSRHQSQHGNVCIEWEEDVINIAPNYFGYIKNLKIFSDGSFEVEANPLGNMHNVVTLKRDTGRPKLPKIENKRHKQTYNQPQNHFENDIRYSSPHDVASMAVEYYLNIYKLALEKFGS
ncbi:TPA: hypothetical protein ACSP2Z_003209 [Aeromonas hydrophila]